MACYLGSRYIGLVLLLTISVNSSICPLQIDLIDMRHLPDQDFKWILHIVDHWSKFNLAFPLVNKGAHDVAEAFTAVETSEYVQQLFPPSLHPTCKQRNVGMRLSFP